MKRKGGKRERENLNEPKQKWEKKISIQLLYYIYIHPFHTLYISDSYQNPISNPSQREKRDRKEKKMTSSKKTILPLQSRKAKSKEKKRRTIKISSTLHFLSFSLTFSLIKHVKQNKTKNNKRTQPPLIFFHITSSLLSSSSSNYWANST